MSDGSHDTLVYRLAQMLVKLNQGERLDPQALAEEFGVNLRTDSARPERAVRVPAAGEGRRALSAGSGVPRQAVHERHRAVCLARRGARVVSVAVG